MPMIPLDRCGQTNDNVVPKTVMVFEPKPMSALSLLDEEHANIFTTALTRLLAIELDKLTFAEIVDGLPTKQSCRDLHLYFNTTNHPLYALDHAELCPSVIKKTRQIKDAFNPMSLAFKTEVCFQQRRDQKHKHANIAQLLSAFQRETPGTQRFELRLLEMLADACHQIASYLYSLDDGVHKHSVYYAWRDSTEPASPDPYVRIPRAPAAFYHSCYGAFRQYPNGIRDVVGYWAETKIFGGVMVFERGESGTECKDVYLHSCWVDQPRTLYPPTPQQYDTLISFLTGPEKLDVPCPLPIHTTTENRWRWDPFHSMTKYNIFRDTYERIPPQSSMKDNFSFTSVDFPEHGDQMRYALREYYASQGEQPFDEAERLLMLENMKKITPSSPAWWEHQET